MAPMKKGTRINLRDTHYQDICVGDTLLDPHTGSELTVSKYGRVVSPIGKSLEKKDVFYRILRRWDENLEKSPVEPVKEKAEEIPAEPVEAPQGEEQKPTQADKDAAIAEQIGEETLTAIKSENAAVARFDGIESADLVAELRRRGWTVTCGRDRVCTVHDEL